MDKPEMLVENQLEYEKKLQEERRDRRRMKEVVDYVQTLLPSGYTAVDKGEYQAFFIYKSNKPSNDHRVQTNYLNFSNIQSKINEVVSLIEQYEKVS